ncbi:MAG: hypothetical protein Q8P40_10980 [Nitrospirota bacterium]|nr:hypothetical protein [Nitrospirota bacterium]
MLVSSHEHGLHRHILYHDEIEDQENIDKDYSKPCKGLPWFPPDNEPYEKTHGNRRKKTYQNPLFGILHESHNKKFKYILRCFSHVLDVESNLITIKVSV